MLHYHSTSSHMFLELRARSHAGIRPVSYLSSPKFVCFLKKYLMLRPHIRLSKWKICKSEAWKNCSQWDDFRITLNKNHFPKQKAFSLLGNLRILYDYCHAVLFFCNKNFLSPSDFHEFPNFNHVFLHAPLPSHHTIK